MESKIIEYEIEQTNLHKFEILNNARKIRNGRVRELAKDIETGIGLKNSIHVNNKNGFYRIIDGNHRYMACKNLLVDNPTKKIKIKLQIYSDLTENQEKELYVILQSSTPQTFNDFIQLFQSEIPILNKINNSFPIKVNIYSRKEAVLTTHLIKAYVNSNSPTASIKTKQDLFELAKGLTNEDYHELKEFFEQYIKFFGNPQQLSPYYKAPALWLTMSLYFRNKNVINKKELWERLFKKVYGSQLMLDLSKTNSFEYASEQRRRIIENLNQGWRGNKFI